MQTQSTQCPICQIDKSVLFGHCDGLTIVRCQTCGLLYVNPRLSDESRRQHYAIEYMPTMEIVQTDFGTRREAAIKFDAEKIQEHKPKGKILDIGCAGGAFLKYFPTASWECYGVEPSEKAAEHAKEVFGINVFEGEFINAQYPSRYFDVVTILDALMLMPDPLAELNEAHRVLRDTGILAIEIPGLEFRLAKNTGIISKMLYGQWMALNPKEHLYFFSDATLRKLLQKANFEVKQIYLSFPSLYGSIVRRAGYLGYFGAIRVLYALTRGRLNFSTKVLYIAQKSQ